VERANHAARAGAAARRAGAVATAVAARRRALRGRRAGRVYDLGRALTTSVSVLARPAPGSSSGEETGT
jgi:hypothetical protein